MRNRRGWQLKGLLIIAIFMAMMIGWYLDQRYGKGLRIGLTGAILLNLGISMLLGFLPDLGISEVQAGNDGIARAFYGHAFGATLWRYQDILRFSFVPQQGSGKPFGLLILMMHGNIVIIGIPNHLQRDDLVSFFQRHGVPEVPA